MGWVGINDKAKVTGMERGKGQLVAGASEVEAEADHVGSCRPYKNFVFSLLSEMHNC